MVRMILRFAALGGGIISSLLLSLFLFRVFCGTDVPYLTHYAPDVTANEMARLGLIAAAYFFLQQQSIAVRDIVGVEWALADVVSSVVPLCVLVIFGWIGLIVSTHHPTEYSMWVLVIFTLVTVADGVYNSYNTIRYLPRAFQA